MISIIMIDLENPHSLLDGMILPEEKNESSVSTRRDNDDIAWRWWNWREAAWKGMRMVKRKRLSSEIMQS